MLSRGPGQSRFTLAVLVVISMGVLTYKGATAKEALASEVVEAVPTWAQRQGFVGNEQATAGAEIFASSGCTACHTYLGTGSSNAGAPDTVILLPLDPDASATRLRDAIKARAGATVAVVVTDTFGRAWREGHVNVAIGIAGLPALKRYMGQFDPEGYELRVTEIAVADEIAAAAELVMGKLDRCPVAVVRGLVVHDPAETAREYVRPATKDLFR